MVGQKFICSRGPLRSTLYYCFRLRIRTTFFLVVNYTSWSVFICTIDCYHIIYTHSIVLFSKYSDIYVPLASSALVSTTIIFFTVHSCISIRSKFLLIVLPLISYCILFIWMVFRKLKDPIMTWCSRNVVQCYFSISFLKLQFRKGIFVYYVLHPMQSIKVSSVYLLLLFII